MSDFSLRQMAHEYLGIAGGFSVRDAFGGPSGSARGSLRSRLEDMGGGPFNIVVLGDSVGWGQGLGIEDKYASQLQRWLASELQPRQVNAPHIRAHSGARIQPGSDRKESPGEIPFGEPTIQTQVDLAAEKLRQAGIDPRYGVDLVLISAGINDVSIFNILSPDPTVGPEWVRKLTRERAVAYMEDLLGRVLQTFPRAKIVVTNYFGIVSTDSSLNLMLYALFVFGLVAPVYLPGAALFTVPWALWLRNKLDKQSEAFNLEYTAQVRQIIDAVDPGRICLADVGFDNSNAMGASSALLYDLGVIDTADFLDFDAKDPVAAEREVQCGQTPGAPPYCKWASLGHPNRLGAQRYAQAIRDGIASKGWLAEWRR